MKVGFLILLMLIVIYCDIRDYKIPNIFISIGWTLGLLMRALSDGIYGVLYGMSAIAIPIIMLIMLFKLRMIGAGDIKLLSVISIMIGIEKGIEVLIYSFLIGAIMSGVKILVYKNLFERTRYFVNYIKDTALTKTTRPYISFDTVDKRHIIHFSICIGIALLIVIIK